LRESMSLQFRAEIFNLLNRANFNTPNLITAVLLPSVTLNTSPTPSKSTNVPVQSPAAGAITSTSTTSRQVQFGLKLHW